MKDLNEIDTILGIKVTTHKDSFALNQSYYKGKISNKFNYLCIKGANTLYDSSIKLIKNEDKSNCSIGVW